MQPVRFPYHRRPSKPDLKENQGENVHTDSSQLNGKKVAELLRKFTTEKDQKEITKIINNEVNSENVMEFIKGYNEYYEGAPKTPFITSLLNEFFFENKQELALKFTQYLREYFENNGNQDAVEKLDVVLNKDYVYTNDYIPINRSEEHTSELQSQR